MSKAYILGNGPSRPTDTEWLFSLDGTTYGCNAMYRDWEPDHLVVNDSAMMVEIVNSTYVGQCHFTDFEELPLEAFDGLQGVEGFNAIDKNKELLNEAIYFGDEESAYSFVFMGKGQGHPSYVIWIDKSLDHIKWGMKPKFFGMSTGLCAFQLALEHGHTQIDMIGFDGLKEKNYKNIYDGTKLYTYDPLMEDKVRRPETYIPIEADKWENCYIALRNEYPKVEVSLI